MKRPGRGQCRSDARRSRHRHARHPHSPPRFTPRDPDRQRPQLPRSERAGRRAVHRRLRARLHHAGPAGRPDAAAATHPANRQLPGGRRGDADLHQPEQPVHRHRRAAGRARHRGQLLPGPRDRPRSDDERAGIPARAHAAGSVLGCGPARRGRHRQGQAAPPARPRPARRHLLLGREGRPGHAGRRRPRRRPRLRRPAAAQRLQRRAERVRVRCRRGPAAGRPGGHDLSVHHRLHPAQMRAGHGGRQCLLRDAGPLPRRARRPRRALCADRRPRHERQDRCRRQTPHHLSAAGAGRRAGPRRGPRHPAHHRPLCRPPWRAGLLRGHLHRPRRRRDGGGARTARCRAGADAAAGRRPLRAAARPHRRRHRRRRAPGRARHRTRAPRPQRAGRAAALAWRPVRAAGAAAVQPPHRRPARRAPAAQFRCLRAAAQPRGLTCTFSTTPCAPSPAWARWPPCPNCWASGGPCC
mmetsp:Transcript_5274/g.19786  ORF Transcript_5274/g.19786 Transcript_5274/m.19786 type:complete len:469 (-) Transcript_5274:1055-2461(-)